MWESDVLPNIYKLQGHFGYQPKNQSNLRYEDGKMDFSASSSHFFTLLPCRMNICIPYNPAEFCHGKTWGGENHPTKIPSAAMSHTKPMDLPKPPCHKIHQCPSRIPKTNPPCVFCDAQNRGLTMRHMTPSPRSEATLLLTCQWSSNVIQRPLARSDARRVFVGSDLCKGGKVKG